MSRTKPRKIDGQLASRTNYYKEQICRIIKGCFEVDCPDTMNKDYILNTLLFRGVLCLSDSNAGMLAYYPSLTDHNYMNMPTRVQTELPLIGSLKKKIDVDCTLYYLEFMRHGWYYNFHKVVDVMAQRLASCDCGIDVNIFNSRTAVAFVAEDKAQAETIKAAMDDISNGNPLVITKSNIINSNGAQLFFNNVKNNYVANDMQDTKRSIINELLTMLGVNNANTDKKERLITGEVDSNNEELEANVNVWKMNLELSNKKTKAIFPDCPFAIRYKYGTVRESNTPQLEKKEENGNDIR